MPDDRCDCPELAARRLAALNRAGVVAYLGLGANVGDRSGNLAAALSELAGAAGVRLLRRSAVYETEPWGYAGQPAFLNCAAEVATTLSPARLLALVKDIEARLGRQPGFRYGPRVIDLDILLFGEAVIHLTEPDLQIPHPRLAERAFVLVPLAELAGGVTHPERGRTIAELREASGGSQGVRPWFRRLGPPEDGGPL